MQTRRRSLFGSPYYDVSGKRYPDYSLWFTICVTSRSIVGAVGSSRTQATSSKECCPKDSEFDSRALQQRCQERASTELRQPNSKELYQYKILDLALIGCPVTLWQRFQLRAQFRASHKESSATMGACANPQLAEAAWVCGDATAFV